MKQLHDDQKHSISDKIEDDWLIAGSNPKRIIFHLYDSSNRLQCEFSEDMAAKQVYQRIQEKNKYGSELKIVRLDMSNAKSIKNLDKLLAMADISVEKVSRKNRPTFLNLTDNKLTKMKPTYFNQKFDDKFQEKFEKDTH
jgi:hypothetical protein